MTAPLLRFTEFTDDWEETTLENLAEVERGKFSVRPRNDPRYFGGEMPFVQTGDVAGSDMYLKGYSQTLNADGIKVSKVFPADTILITIAANIGDTTITRYAVACPDSVVAIQSKKDKANTIFLKNLIDLQKEVLDSQATQNAQKNINLQVLKPLELFAPSIEEQTKIASFLSTVDEKISQLNRKHELLSQYKQGMMQKLFSQQIRFKANDGSEFGEWEQVRLGNLVDLISGFAFKSDFFSEDGNKLITPKNFTTTGKANFTDTNTKWTTEISDKKYICRPNDLLVLLTDLTQSCELLGKPILLSQDDGNVLLNQRIVKIIPNRKLEKPFLLYLLLTDDFHELIVSTASGTTVKHSSNKVLQSFNFYLPCLEEQTKIANFLSAIDQKIEVVTQQIEQAKTWKKGLLQQMFV